MNRDWRFAARDDLAGLSENRDAGGEVGDKDHPIHVDIDIHRYIERRPFGNKTAVLVKELHAVIVLINYIHSIVWVNPDRMRIRKLSRPSSGTAPGHEKVAVRREFVDCRISVTVRHEDVS